MALAYHQHNGLVGQRREIELVLILRTSQAANGQLDLPTGQQERDFIAGFTHDFQIQQGPALF